MIFALRAKWHEYGRGLSTILQIRILNLEPRKLLQTRGAEYPNSGLLFSFLFSQTQLLNHLRGSIFKKSASLKIFTPNSCALVSFEPASAPARTKSVFLLTLPVTLPPSASIFAVASSRVSAGSVPVRTNIFPANA